MLNELINETHKSPTDNNIKEEEGDADRYNNEEIVKLVELLRRKTKEDDVLDITKSKEKKNKIGMLFWSNEEMRNKYFAFRDIVFINKRIISNRFGMPMFLIYVITSEG